MATVNFELSYVYKSKLPTRYIKTDSSGMPQVLLPIVGGHGISSDNTCQSVKELKRFLSAFGPELERYKREIEAKLLPLKMVIPDSSDDTSTGSVLARILNFRRHKATGSDSQPAPQSQRADSLNTSEVPSAQFPPSLETKYKNLTKALEAIKTFYEPHFKHFRELIEPEIASSTYPSYPEGVMTAIRVLTQSGKGNIRTMLLSPERRDDYLRFPHEHSPLQLNRDAPAKNDKTFANLLRKKLRDNPLTEARGAGPFLVKFWKELGLSKTDDVDTDNFNALKNLITIKFGLKDGLKPSPKHITSYLTSDFFDCYQKFLYQMRNLMGDGDWEPEDLEDMFDYFFRFGQGLDDVGSRETAIQLATGNIESPFGNAGEIKNVELTCIKVQVFIGVVACFLSAKGVNLTGNGWDWQSWRHGDFSKNLDGPKATAHVAKVYEALTGTDGSEDVEDGLMRNFLSAIDGRIDIAFEENPKYAAEASKLFKERYASIKSSPHFDEFLMVLEPSEDSCSTLQASNTLCENYCGAICMPYTQVAKKYPFTDLFEKILYSNNPPASSTRSLLAAATSPEASAVPAESLSLISLSVSNLSRDLSTKYKNGTIDCSCLAEFLLMELRHTIGVTASESGATASKKQVMRVYHSLLAQGSAFRERLENGDFKRFSSTCEPLTLARLQTKMEEILRLSEGEDSDGSKFRNEIVEQTQNESVIRLRSFVHPMTVRFEITKDIASSLYKKADLLLKGDAEKQEKLSKTVNLEAARKLQLSFKFIDNKKH